MYWSSTFLNKCVWRRVSPSRSVPWVSATYGEFLISMIVFAFETLCHPHFYCFIVLRCHHWIGEKQMSTEVNFLFLFTKSSFSPLFWVRNQCCECTYPRTQKVLWFCRYGAACIITEQYPADLHQSHCSKTAGDTSAKGKAGFFAFEFGYLLHFSFRSPSKSTGLSKPRTQNSKAIPSNFTALFEHFKATTQPAGSDLTQNQDEVHSRILTARLLK